MSLSLITRLKATLAVFFISMFTSFLVTQTSLMQDLEWTVFDLESQLFADEVSPPDDVAVILIDEASLAMMNPLVGRWPWPRSVHADVIDFLVMGGAERIVFDILFTEHEDRLNQGRLNENDQRLVESVAAAGNVVMAAQLLEDERDDFNQTLLHRPLPKEVVDRFSLDVPLKFKHQTEANNYYLPFPELTEVSERLAIVEFAPDRDGVYRRTRLFRSYEGTYFPALSTGALPSSELDRILRPDSPIPLSNSSYLIRMYRGFAPYSISGILASIQKIYNGEVENLPVDPAEFEGKTVFIGASAVGVEDLKLTPLDTLTPGVFLHASIYGNIRQNNYLSEIPQPVSYGVMIVAAMATVFSNLFLSNMRRRILATAAIFCLLIGGGLALFAYNIVLPLVAPSVSLLAASLSSFIYLGATEGRDKRRIRAMLGQYVSPAMLASVIDSGGSVLKAEVGTRERLSILFSDIRGFTSLSEHLPAEQVVEILNGYFSGMVDIIFDNEGTLDKFIGDAIMAFWGAPIKLDDHAARAVTSAMHMTRWLEEFNHQLKRDNLPQLAIGVGIHTGEVILGNIGSERKLDYTVIGDNVNLASRIEGLTKPYGAAVLISEDTFGELDGAAICRIVDQVRVKGKKLPTAIYEVLALEDDPSAIKEHARTVSTLTGSAFNLYLNGQWSEAEGAYRTLGATFPGDPLADIFVERCVQYRDTPPSSWDGVYTLRTK